MERDTAALPAATEAALCIAMCGDMGDAGIGA